MNILFFLSPKQDLMYVYDDFTLRQTLEKWENNRYASIPVLNRRGEYVGTLTEGDILWGLKKYHGLDLEAAEDVPISAFPHKRDYKAVTVTTSMDQLIEAAMNQNFVQMKLPLFLPEFRIMRRFPGIYGKVGQIRYRPFANADIGRMRH